MNWINNMTTRILPLIGFALLLLFSHHSLGQVQTGVWKSTPGNTDFHHFVRNGGGAAVYINQESTTSSHSILRLSSGSAEANKNVKFTVENNGNVGIGTSAPNAKLDVRGGISINGANSISSVNKFRNVLELISPHHSAIVFNPGQTTELMFGFHSNGNFYWGTGQNAGNSYGMFLNGKKGDLGIKGNLTANEVKVKTGGWADHVFLPEYPLMPLDKLEAFVGQHGHLPNIPTEAEVLQNGIELGEMNAKLLEKVEELTLYIIQQEKINQEQAKLLEAQQKILEGLVKKANIGPIL